MDSENTFDDAGDESTGLNADGSQAGTPRALREYADRTAAENKALKAELAKREKAERQSKLDRLITNGLPEKAIALIGDRDPDEWYAEFGDVFPAQAASEGNAPAQANQAPPAATVPADQVDQIRSMSEVQPGQFNPGANAQVMSELDNLVASAKSEDEFLAGLDKMGALNRPR